MAINRTGSCHVSALDSSIEGVGRVDVSCTALRQAGQLTRLASDNASSSSRVEESRTWSRTVVCGGLGKAML